MHVNVIGILAGSLSSREPARRLGIAKKLMNFNVFDFFALLGDNLA
jgi:hypothetical protein